MFHILRVHLSLTSVILIDLTPYIDWPVIPKLYDQWLEKYQRVVFPLNLLFSFAWSLEMWADIFPFDSFSVQLEERVQGNTFVSQHSPWFFPSFFNASIERRRSDHALFTQYNTFGRSARSHWSLQFVTYTLLSSRRTMFWVIPCHRRSFADILVQKHLLPHLSGRVYIRVCLRSRRDYSKL